MDLNLVTNIETCYVDIPQLLYYSHIPSAILALTIGIFVFLKNREMLISKILFTICIAFSLWSLFSLITWTSYDSRLIMAVWSIFGFLYAFIYISSLYFFYVFIDKKDISLCSKVGSAESSIIIKIY